MRDAYVHRDDRGFEAQLEARNATAQAAFLVSHLRPGMRVIDLGCGPGTITLGLARAVEPGEAVGVDLQESQVERARAVAAERQVANVRFERADAYELPFPDASFDAALAHMVLLHLAEPVRALREVRRVLRPGGLVGVRDADLRTTVRWPTSPEFERFLDLRLRAHRLQGTDGQVGRQHRQLLLEAGFARAETRTLTVGGGSADEVPLRARWLVAQLESIGRIGVENGWIDQAGCDAIAAEMGAWAKRPDGVMFTVVCESLGWV